MSPKQALAPQPSEYEEMRIVAKWLDARGVHWFHPPNEGKRHFGTAAKLKACGLKAGASDVLIFSRAPNFPMLRGVAIELKRRKGGVVSDAQRTFLERCADNGWLAQVCHGAEDAIALLTSLGY